MKSFKYLSVEDGTSINSVMGVQQAVICLELAGEIAASNKDVEGLIKLAKGWLEFGSQVEDLLPEGEDEEEDEKPTAKGKKLESYGFAKAIIEKAGDEEDGESGATDED